MKKTNNSPFGKSGGFALAAALALACSNLAAEAANLWDGGGADDLWTTAQNWDDDTVPTFGNTADLTFTAASPVLTNSSIASDTTIRSLTFDGDAPGILIRTRAEGTNIAAGRTLTFAAPSGNATITIAPDVGNGARHLIRGFGVTNDGVTFGSGGVIELSTSLDVINNGAALAVNNFTMGQNNDGINANSETVIQGTGGINKSGPGDLTIAGPNTFSGGLTLAGGRATLDHNNAAGPGNITISGTEVTLLLQNNFGLNVTNALIISDTGNKKYLRSFNNSPANTYSGNIDIQETTLGNFEVQAQAGTFTISGNITGGGGAGLRKANNGILRLTGANTYTGETVVNNGTLELFGSATLPNTSRISISSGKIFNVSGLSSTFTLGPGQELSGNATAPGGSVVGNIDAGSGTLRFPYNSTNLAPALSISGGNLTMNNNTSIVFVVGSPLTNGSYQLTSGGAVVGTVASSPRVTVQGGGLVPGRMGTLSITGGDLFMDVTNIPVPTPESLLATNDGGTNLVLSWSQWQFSLQVQTNELNTGLSNNWSNLGGVSPRTVGINPTNPAVFYRLYFTNYP